MQNASGYLNEFNLTSANPTTASAPFIGFVLIFVSASYLILLIPEWNFMLTVGTLIVYYTAINLHGERRHE